MFEVEKSDEKKPQSMFYGAFVKGKLGFDREEDFSIFLDTFEF